MSDWEPKIKASATAVESKPEKPDTKPTKTVFKIRVIYKGGAAVDFDCYTFKVTRDVGVTYQWEPAGECHPIQLGADEVAAVWQMGMYEE